MPKINFIAEGKGTVEEAERNHSHAKNLGVPEIVPAKVHSTPLAVVGGGYSINWHVEELKAWSGDIWAINGAFQWCRERNIDATLFSCDPAVENVTGAKKALLAQTCQPAVFDALKGSDVQLFIIGPGGLGTGPSSATSALMLAPTLGYANVTFFGCESSYWGDRSHAYAEDEPKPWRLLVRCDGEDYLTEIEYLMQAEYLAGCIERFPHIYKEKSGGLLSAMVRSKGDYDVTHISKEMSEQFEFRAA